MFMAFSDKAFFGKTLRSQIESFFKEDDLDKNSFYMERLPDGPVDCFLKFKTEGTLISGLPFFIECFSFLGARNENLNHLLDKEGHFVKLNPDGTPLTLTFRLPFSIALTGERLALNLLQRSSSIATMTSGFVRKANEKGISILDTRKTLPGLRFLDKYSVRVGGGKNHRFGQTDVWMVKDNHKSFFGGVGEAITFFRSMGGFYTPLVVEIHNLEELECAKNLNVKHFLLDNFGPEEIVEAVKMKKREMTFEVSGGMNLDNVESYLIEGVDAISVGCLTHSPQLIDISMKLRKSEN
jgi:nicotinate-nucleotide pyrophosphorylase (carboxylating)